MGKAGSMLGAWPYASACSLIPSGFSDCPLTPMSSNGFQKWTSRDVVSWSDATRTLEYRLEEKQAQLDEIGSATSGLVQIWISKALNL